MMWGCFSYDNVGNLFILSKKTSVNNFVYHELLYDNMEDCFNKTQAEIFQQDGASCHTVHDIIQWPDNYRTVRIHDRPSNSLDIENLCVIIKGNLDTYQT